jgi:hypothetical protein
LKATLGVSHGKRLRARVEAFKKPLAAVDVTLSSGPSWELVSSRRPGVGTCELRTGDRVVHRTGGARARSRGIPEINDVYGWLCGSWDLDVLHYRRVNVTGVA